MLYETVTLTSSGGASTAPDVYCPDAREADGADASRFLRGAFSQKGLI